MRFRSVFGVLALSALAGACTSSSPEDPTAAPVTAATESPAAIWNQSGISDYTMTYTSSCGDSAWISLDPVTVEVAAGEVERISGDTPGKLATVANLFGLIDAARAGSALRVDATYGEWGQPMEVDIDYSGGLDDQFCVSVSDFEPASGG